MDALTQDTFLSLVRLGIGQENASVPDSIDWTAMRTLASKQGLSAIVLDGIQSLCDKGLLVDGMAMDFECKQSWVSLVLDKYELRYEHYTKRLAALARFYNTHGFRMMALKGYGLGLNYPVPMHRPCGDIDIWAFGQYKEADAALAKEFSINIDDSHHHHTVFLFKGYSVENHYDFVNVHYGHGNAELEKILKHLAEDDSYYVEVEGEKIYLPSPDLNALFLLRHAMLHFASTDMNLRQILDWGFFMQKYSSSVNWDYVLGVMDQFSMRPFFSCLNAICVEDFGFDESLFPDYRCTPVLRERVLNDALSPEFSDSEPAGLLPRFAWKYRRWNANAWKQELCYGDSRLKSFVTSVWSHLLKPSSI